MAKMIQSTGKYTRKDGTDVTYSFEYPVYSTLQDAISELGEAEVLNLVQRMAKVDANNTTREKAKVANGDSVRKPMSEEAKAEAKAKRQEEQGILAKLKAAGIGSVEELAKLLG